MSAARGLRIGHGVDAHRFVAGRPLMLGCLEVPTDQGLDGHSDGDAATHALCSAILGGAGAGDLGTHFPSSDERWRGAPSREFLAGAVAVAAERGWMLQSAQVVVIAARPRLAPYLDGMSRRLEEVAGAAAGAVAVGVTSTDGMGFTGRSEGIAASAVVLLSPIS